MFNPFKKQPTLGTDPFRERLPDDGKTYEDFVKNDVAVKIWLPALLVKRLEELHLHFDESRPQLLRCIFFAYVYGRYDFEQMRSKSAGLFHSDRGTLRQDSAPYGPITHRSGPNTTPELGKNAEDIKLSLPSKLRDELQSLANKCRKPHSQFLREILVSSLLGHRYLREHVERRPQNGTMKTRRQKNNRGIRADVS